MRRLYWPCWAAAVAATGIVAGFMLGHALLLGPYVDWLLIAGRARVLADTYPVFARSAGRGWLAAYYAVAGLQVLAGVAFAVVSVSSRQRAGTGALIGVGAVLWPVVHYASGFGALEAQVLRSTVEAPRAVAETFVRWNGAVHGFHAATLGTVLALLLSVPLSARDKPVHSDG